MLLPSYGYNNFIEEYPDLYIPSPCPPQNCNTAIHKAVLACLPNTVKLLRQAGARINVQNTNRETALDISTRKAYYNIIVQLSGRFWLVPLRGAAKIYLPRAHSRLMNFKINGLQVAKKRSRISSLRYCRSSRSGGSGWSWHALKWWKSVSHGSQWWKSSASATSWPLLRSSAPKGSSRHPVARRVAHLVRQVAIVWGGLLSLATSPVLGRVHGPNSAHNVPSWV